MRNKFDLLISTVKNRRDTKPQVMAFSGLNNFGAWLKNQHHISNQKDGLAFIRGECKGGRNKDDLDCTRLLIIDADHIKDETSVGSIEPEMLRNALDDMDLAYVMYASFSNNPSAGVWKHRTIIECSKDITSPEQLQHNMMELMERLWSRDAMVEYGKEMGAWAQIWYTPRSVSDDRYFWYERKGKKWKTLDLPSGGGDGKLTNLIGNNAKPDDKTPYSTNWDTKIGDIITGKEYHEGLRDLSYALSNNKFPLTAVEELCRGLVMLSPESDRREERLRELPGLVQGAFNRRSEIIAPDFTMPTEIRREKRGPMPTPVGLFGRMVEDAMRQQAYKNEKVAFVSVIGLIAGVCGRKFNVEGMGLNLYIMLSMPTGRGKKFLGDYISKAIEGSSITDTRFLGAKRFTGPKALCDMLEDGLSRVCVQSELGQMMSSTAGDVKGLTRMVLEIYEQSGYGHYLSGEAYSNKDHSIATLHSPALTLVGESVPGSLQKALKEDDNAQSGYLPRFLLFAVDEPKPFANRNRQTGLGEEAKAKIEHLIKVCKDAQGSVFLEDKVFKMQWEDGIRKQWQDYQDKWVSVTNSYGADECLKQAMSNRVAAIVAKLAAIHAVINNDGLFINQEDLDWGIRMGEWCYDGVDEFLFDEKGNIETSDNNEIIKIALKSCKDLLNPERCVPNGTPSNKCQGNLWEYERVNFILPGKVLLRSLNRKKAIKSLDNDLKKTSYVKSGGSKVIMMLLEAGHIKEVDYVRELKKDRGNEKSYQLTASAEEFM